MRSFSPDACYLSIILLLWSPLEYGVRSSILSHSFGNSTCTIRIRRSKSLLSFVLELVKIHPSRWIIWRINFFAIFPSIIHADFALRSDFNRSSLRSHLRLPLAYRWVESKFEVRCSLFVLNWLWNKVSVVSLSIVGQAWGRSVGALTGPDLEIIDPEFGFHVDVHGAWSTWVSLDGSWISELSMLLSLIFVLVI